ncbi:MAG: hypothetical protein ACJ786_03105 [Catenulispora sp.]
MTISQSGEPLRPSRRRLLGTALAAGVAVPLGVAGPASASGPAPAAAPKASAEPNVATFWTHLTGWRLNLQPDGAVHTCYSDLEGVMTQVARNVGLSQPDLESYIGTLDPAEGVRILQAYPRAFFDQHLRHRPSRLLDGPSPDFPSVKFLP